MRTTGTDRIRDAVAGALVPFWALAASGCGSSTGGSAPSAAAGAASNPSGILELNMTNNSNYRSGEPEIAVNPLDPDNLVYVTTKYKYARVSLFGENVLEIPNAIAQLPPTSVLFPGTLNCYLYYSPDGGHHWQSVPVPLGDLAHCADPMVAVSANGIFYVAFDWMGDPATDVIPNHPLTNTIGVIYSTDGGRSWSNPPVPTGTGLDRPFFRVDIKTGKLYEESGTFSRRLAVSEGLDPRCDPRESSYDATLAPGECLQFTRPNDSPVPPTFAPSSFPGNHIAVHDGILATAQQGSASLFGGVGPGVGPTQLVFHVSTDDGETFTAYPITDGAGNAVTGGTGDYVSADPTRTGRFAVMQLNNANAYEIYLTEDSGKTWRGPAVIAPGPGPHKPWMDFGSTGLLGVLWKTSDIDVYSAVSFDDGHTFSAPLKVSSVTTAPDPETDFAGDDLSWISLDGQYAYAGWGDTRTGFLNSYFAKVPLSAYRR